MPSGHGGTSGWPLTKWASGTDMACERPGRARSGDTISVLWLKRPIPSRIRPPAASGAVEPDRVGGEVAEHERRQVVAEHNREHRIGAGEQLVERPPPAALVRHRLE